MSTPTYRVAVVTGQLTKNFVSIQTALKELLEIGNEGFPPKLDIEIVLRHGSLETAVRTKIMPEAPENRGRRLEILKMCQFW
jgi:hypothetical protein